MLHTPQTNERDLLKELIGAAFSNKARAAEIRDLLFAKSEIADNATLTYTAALARQMHISKQYCLPPHRPLRFTTWQNGEPLTVQVPTDPHERLFPQLPRS